MSTMKQLFCALKQTQASDFGNPDAILDMVREWKSMGENLFKSLVDCFSDIDSREKNLNLVRESLEERLKDLEERERKFCLFEEEKKQELKMREEKLDEQLKLVHEHIESLEVSQSEVERLRLLGCDKLKEIDEREREMGFTDGLLEKRSREVEKREKEFDAFRNDKLSELALKVELLSREKKDFVEEVKLASEKLREKHKLGSGLIERLDSALNMLEGMKAMMDERFKEMESWETVAHDSLTARLDEADLIQESLEKRSKDLEKIEKELNLFKEKKTNSEDDAAVSKKNKTEERKQELELKQGNSEICKKEHDIRKLDLEAHDWRGECPSSVIEFSQTCVKENLVLSKLHQPHGKLVGNNTGLIAYKDQQLECRPKEVELGGNLSDVNFKEHNLKQSELTDALGAHSTTEQDESVDLKYVLQKDGKKLEMFINSAEKDLELMDDEIFKILLLSSDPAKLVLDAVEGFYAPCMWKDGTELKMRRLGVLLLDQLTKMSPKIQPCVTEAAIKLALDWKSKMSATSDSPLKVLGFLHLLAAYNISSHFDKNELFSFLKLVALHKQAPELCRILGLTEKIPGFIQNLINEKQYLLASTYIYECELEYKFPQAAVLNYYVKHSKLSAKLKSRRQHNSSEAKERAITGEIADLHVAIEHIIKYGLESDYSTEVLTARIKQLERNQASLRCGISSSSAGIQKQEKGKISWGANKRKRQNQHEKAKEVATGPKAQRPHQGSENGSSFTWKSQYGQSKTAKHPVTFPVGLRKYGDFVDEVLVTQSSGSHKRHRTGR